MQMPKPGPGHAVLERLSGTWEGEEKMHPSPWDPEGGIATGRTKSHLTLNGFALITDYEQERDGAISFTGHGVWTFDPTRDLCVLHWFDCMGSPPEVFEGRFEGDTLTISHAGPMHAKFTYEFMGRDSMRTRMEMSEDGRNWKRMFDGTYRRA